LEEAVKIFLAALVLSLVIVQSFLSPAAVKAIDPDCPVNVTVTTTTFPVTDITSTTATFNAKICITIEPSLQRKLGQGDLQTPFIFQYSTASDSEIHQVPAIPVSTQFMENTICAIFKASAQNLTPCAQYSVQFKFLGGIFIDGVVGAVGAPTDCVLLFNRPAVSFQTTGCAISTVPHQAGGMGAVAPSAKPFLMSNIVVQTAAISNPKVSPGEMVEIIANTANKGASNGDAKVTLYINGQEVESKGVSLVGGAAAPVHFYVTRNEPGTYSVYVGGVSAGAFVVDLFTNNDILIYGLIALFTIGIGGVLYLVTRRRTM
jgi:hypothetical protein